jgi:hypothetical protein
MAVLGPFVAGLLAYLLGNQTVGDATFLPEVNKTLLPHCNADFNPISSVLGR